MFESSASCDAILRFNNQMRWETISVLFFFFFFWWWWWVVGVDPTSKRSKQKKKGKKTPQTIKPIQTPKPTEKVFLIIWSFSHLFNSFIHSLTHRLFWCFALRDSKCILPIFLGWQRLSENKKCIWMHVTPWILTSKYNVHLWKVVGVHSLWQSHPCSYKQSETLCFGFGFLIYKFSSYQSKWVAKGQITSWMHFLWGHLLALISS